MLYNNLLKGNTMSEQFKLEDRYIVIKLSDASEYLTKSGLSELLLTEMLIQGARVQQGKERLETLVVEKSWPEYGAVYSMLERRSYEELLTEGSDFKFCSKYSSDPLQVYHAMVGPEWVDVTWTSAYGVYYHSKYSATYMSRALVKGDFYLAKKS